MHPVIVRSLQLLRGGRRARHVVPAVLLGATAGAACGWNLTFALLAIAALVFNGPLIATATAAVVAWSLTQAAGGLLHSCGFFLVEKLGFGVVVDSLGHGPLAALSGWDDYTLVGGVFAALCCALPAAHALARRTVPADVGLAPPERLLRPYWPAIGAVGLLLIGVLPQAVGPQLVGDALIAQWSAALGAPLTTEEISYDIWRGELNVQGLRIYGLNEPGRVAMRLDRLTAHLDPGLLLRGCFHCDDATLSGLSCDDAPAAAGQSASLQPTVLREDDPREASTKQPLDVARYVRGWSDVERRLTVLGGLVGAVELVADLETQQPAAARLQDVRRPRKSPLDPLSGRSLPLVQVKRLTLTGLPESWSLGPQALLELTNVTSRPGASARPVQLAIECPDYRARLAVEFGLNGPERRHDLTVSWHDAATASILDARRAAAVGLDVAYGRVVSVSGQGRLTRDRLELPLVCEVRGVVPTAGSGRFGNVDAGVWHDAIARLGGLRFDAALSGRLADARLQIVPAGMVDHLKHQLRASGEHALVKAVEAGRIVSEPPRPIVAATEPKPSTTTPPVAPLAPPVAKLEPVIAKSETSASPTAVQAAGAAELKTPAVVATSAASASVAPPIPTPIVPTAEALSAAPPTNNEPPAAKPPVPTVSYELRQPGEVAEPSAGLGEVHWKPDFTAANETRPNLANPTNRPPTASVPRGLTNMPARPTAPRPASPMIEPKPSLMAKIGGWFTSDDEPETAAVLPPPPSTATAKPMFPRLRAMFVGEPEPEIADYATMPPPGRRLPPAVPPTAAERPTAIPSDTIDPRSYPAETAEKPWYQRVFR